MSLPKRKRALFVITLTFILSLPGTWGKNISEIITYEEWTELVKHSVRRIPELRELWKWRQRTRRHIYLTGGALRGLLQWLHGNLQNHSLEEIRKMEIPKVRDLLILKGADLDLIVPKGTVDKLQEELPYYTSWDFINDQLTGESTAMGGTTLEKVGVNPSRIIDPLDGLKHYYEGELVFHWVPEGEFRQLDLVRQKGNTKTALALRFLRIEQNMPELTATPESYRRISQIERAEMLSLEPEHASYHFHWIQKRGLAKLYQSTGSNFPETLDILRRRDLLGILAYHQLGIPYISRHQRQDYLDDLVERGFTPRDLILVHKMQMQMMPARDAAASAKQVLDIITRNPEEFAKFTMSLTSNPRNFHTNAINRFIREGLNDLQQSPTPTKSCSQNMRPFLVPSLVHRR